MLILIVAANKKRWKEEEEGLMEFKAKWVTARK